MLAVGAAVPAPAGAEESGPDLTRIGIEAIMNLEVTSVSKRPERSMDATAGLFVITSDEIRRSGATSIPELLRMVPGVHVARIDANKWAVGIRGFSSRLARSLLVLIDGRSVYSPLFAGVYWEVQDTLLEDIDRIEVIRGPGGTLWGANAVNGVINIITKDAARSQGKFVAIRGGNELRGQGSARYGGTTRGGVAYRAYAKFNDVDDGFNRTTPDFDAWWLGRAGFRADTTTDSGDSVTLQGDVYAGRTGQHTTITGYDAPYIETVFADSDLSGGNLLGRWRRDLPGGSVLTTQFFHDRTHRIDPTFSEDRNTWDLEVQHRLHPSSRHDLLWGAGARVTSDETSAVPTIQFVPGSRTDSVLSAFVQDSIVLAPGKASLTIGTKLEHNDYSGFEYQPNVRFLLTPTARHSFWSAVSRSVRVPSRVDHDLELTGLLDPSGPTFLRIFGTPSFRSERLLSFEIGYRAQATDSLFLDGTAFHYAYDDLQSLEFGTPFAESTPPPDHFVVPVLLRNMISARVQGAEIAATWHPKGALRLSGSYAWLDLEATPDPGSTDPATAAVIEGSSARHTARLRMSLDLPRGLDVTGMLRYVGRLPTQDVEGYTDLDLTIGWHPTPDLELMLCGRNLLSARHPEFGAGGGFQTELQRNVYGSVVRRW